MNLIKFLRDVLIWLTENYSALPVDFKDRFPKEDFVNARIYFYDLCDYDSELNMDFVDYE